MEAGDPCLVRGFSIGGYRSFGALQRFRPLSKVTLVAGQNNVGKTNVLHFLQRICPQTAAFTLEALDQSRLSGVDRVRIGRLHRAVAFPRETFRQSGEHGVALLASLLGLCADDVLGDAYWLNYEAPYVPPNQQTAWTFAEAFVDDLLQELGEPQVLSQLALDLTSSSSGPRNDLGAILIRALSADPVPETLFVPTQRVLTAGAMDEATGQGMINKLQRMQNPDLDEEAARAGFDAVETLIREVLGDPAARLEVPAAATTLLVTVHGRRLPVDRLGSGIAQAIVLACLAVTRERTLLLVEEPEANLHPSLQRHLLRFLLEETNNQYVIATHSATFLNTPGTATFHVVQGEESESRARLCPRPEDLSRICHDLGFRPSDLLQSNAVIWVEGPSDRIYVAHWLKQAAPQFLEDYDFTILFYGGSTLNGLHASDAEVQQFISLRRLNRYHAVLMDSDCAAASDTINATKQRLLEELADPETHSFGWVTPGRTIENLVPTALLVSAVSDVHPLVARHYTPPTSEYQPPLAFEPQHRPDKVAIARAVCERWAPDDFGPAVAELIASLLALIGAASQVGAQRR